jgi:AraC-like DNA-binding protein
MRRVTGGALVFGGGFAHDATTMRRVPPECESSFVILLFFFVMLRQTAARMNQPGLITIASASANETRRDPRYRWHGLNRGDTPFVIVQLTQRGTGGFRDADGQRPVRAGQAFISIVPENAEYFFPAGVAEPWNFCWVDFQGALAITLWQSLRARFGPILSLPDKSAAALALHRLIAQARRRESQDPFELSRQCYDFYLRCWQRQLEAARGNRTSLRELAEFHAQHHRQPVTIKELADLAGLSREHFTRRFRRELAVTPAAYLRRHRLRRAVELLAGTDLPAVEVARYCGFSSSQQLAKVFRREHGVAPLAYRQSRQS